MHKSLLIVAAGASSILAATAASAADLPIFTKAPQINAPASAYGWTGLYGGLNAGYVGEDGTSVTGVPLFASGVGASVAFNAIEAAGATGTFQSIKGFIGGAQLGYNWQADTIVYGLEADFDGTSAHRDTAVVNVNPAPAGVTNTTTIVNSQRLEYIGTVRGRLGLLTANNTLLFYGTGGLAYGQTTSGGAVSEAPLNGGGFPVVNTTAANNSISGMRYGYAAGGGVEWMVAQGWSLKAEGLYYDLGTARNASSFSSTTIPVGTLFTTTGVLTSVSERGVIARGGVNFHF